MKVLFVGDATVSSGFARCTHAACDALHAAGHEVHVIGLNYWGDPHPYPYKIYPAYQPLDGSSDYFGLNRLPRMILRLRPDAVVILNDPWSIPAYMDSLKQMDFAVPRPPVIGWLAVDSMNGPGYMLNDLAHVVTWTEFGAHTLKVGGYKGETSIVPLGVDTAAFYPRDRAEARRKVMPAELPEDAFIVGVVGRNQQRKRLDLTLRYFSLWIRSEGIENAYLYIHSAPTGDQSAHIPSLVRFYDLAKRVITCNPYLGKGESDEYMANVYSALDVYTTTSQAEGWGLPALEAMACGTACLLPDFAAFDRALGWTRDAAVLCAAGPTSLTGPMNLNGAYTIGRAPDEDDFIRELNNLYTAEFHRRTFQRRGPKLAAQLTWASTGDQFRRMLETVVSAQETPLPQVLGDDSGAPTIEPVPAPTEPTDDLATDPQETGGVTSEECAQQP